MLMQFTNYKTEVLETADKFFADKLKEKVGLKFYKDSLTKIFDSTQDGKMIRSGLFLETFEILSGKKPGISEFKIALAIEIFQTSLLIHDDIMDNSMLRRGKPSIFAQFLKEMQDKERASSLSICNGDLGFFLGFEILSEIPLLNIEILQKFSKEFGLVCIAQMSDIDPSKKSEKEIINLYRYKTAHYSFSLPLSLAAIHSGKTSDSKGLEEIGENIGILFQIRDDFLDNFGDPQKTGKPIGTDLKEKKQTLHSLLGEKKVSKLIQKIEIETLGLIDKYLKEPKLKRLLVEIIYFNNLREA